MNLPAFSVKRPILTTMITLIVVTLGAVSLTRLRIDLLPEVELPTLSIRTEYEGASPEVMERLVTSVIEEIVATVPGVQEMTSESSEGSSNVRVTFGWGSDIDTATLDIQTRIEAEIDELPDEVVRPQVRKFDIASFPVVVLGISSRLDPVSLTTLIEDQVRNRFARIPGVAQVDVWGGYEREVRVALDPDRVRALGIPLDRILVALRSANLDLPAGKIEEGRYEVTLRAPAEFEDLDQIRDTVVFERDAAVVTLGQVATVVDTHRKLPRLVRVNGERGVRVAVRKQADANTVQVANAVLAEIERTNSDLPELNIVPVINQGNFIERSIENVARSVLYGGGLAVFVLLFFLRSFRSTLVISLAIPISVVATFALIFFGGFTLNLMTLGGLALGVGMIVDSAVVVIENVYRRRDENGEAPGVAAVEGAREVAGAIVASTLTTLVIFVPLAFVRGVSGVLFQELAYVIAFSLLCSLVVALTLVPMLASKLLRARRPEEEHSLSGRFVAFTGLFFTALDNAYRDALRLALRFRLLTVLIACGVISAGLLLLPRIGSEFMPPSDEGEVRVTGEMEVGTRLGLVDRQTRRMEAIVKQYVPEMESSVATVGASGREPDARSTGEIRLSLGSSATRTRSNTEVAAVLRKRLTDQIPGMVVRTRAPQGQFLLQRILGGDEGLEVEMQGFDLEILDALSQRTAAVLGEVPGVVDIEVSRSDGAPQQEIKVNREKAADLKLTAKDVTEVLETAVAGAPAGEYRVDGNSYRILVQLADVERIPLDDLLDLTLSSDGGEPVALRSVVTTKFSRGPLLIERKDQQRIVKVKANVIGRDLGSVAREVQAKLDELPRPTGYDVRVAGVFEEQERAFGELVLSLAMALALVYMVLASQYESLKAPLVVMLSVPFAGVGVIVTLFLTDTTLNVQSYIGCIMLGGIVVNNAILLVDQAGQLRREGYATNDAVAEAGRRRLRPILMTTLTTVLALIPLALGIGEGADAQAPLARAVVGGLSGSTLVTLFLVPAVYSLFHRDRKPAS